MVAGFFCWRKLLRILCFCGDLRKFSPRKSIFKQLDTALVGVVHWVTANSRKFSPRKSIFKQLDTALVGVVHWVTANSRKFSPRKSIFKQLDTALVVSGRGALGYRKFTKVFSVKIYFQAIRESFLPRNKLAIQYVVSK